MNTFAPRLYNVVRSLNHHQAASHTTATMPPSATTPRHSAALGRMLVGWEEYAAAHRARFDSVIEEDYILGPAWETIGRALRVLLNGETGGFDAGSLDANILNTAAGNGVNLEE